MAVRKSRCLWSVWCEQQRRNCSVLVEASWPIQPVELVVTNQWEKALWLAVQVSRTTQERKTWIQRGKASWACCCDSSLFFCFASPPVPFTTFYQTYYQLEAAALVRVGSEMLLNHNSLYICGEGFVLQVQHVRVCCSPAVVFEVWTVPLFDRTAADKSKRSSRSCCQLFFVISLVWRSLNEPAVMHSGSVSSCWKEPFSYMTWP